MRWRFSRRPKYKRSGEAAYYTPASLFTKHYELALTLSIIAHRYLFGLIYSGVLPEYFHQMPLGSGVFVAPIVPTSCLSTAVTKPGDVDLLVLPYEGDEIILDKILAFEIKAIRATFLKQGKSPNTLGFTQAEGLLAMGFPYVGLLHLIVSDESPTEALRPMGVGRILDQYGRCELLPEMNVDWIPVDLMERALGRLKAAATNPQIGLVSAYLITQNDELFSTRGRSTWHPSTSSATVNERMDVNFLMSVGSFFEKNAQAFMDIPRYDPFSAGKPSG